MGSRCSCLLKIKETYMGIQYVRQINDATTNQTVFHGGSNSDTFLCSSLHTVLTRCPTLNPKPWQSVHRVLQIAAHGLCCTSLLTSHLHMHINKDLNQKGQIQMQWSIRPAGTDFQFGIPQPFLPVTFLENDFLTLWLRQFLITFQWTADGSFPKSQIFGLDFYLFLKDMAFRWCLSAVDYF